MKRGCVDEEAIVGLGANVGGSAAIVRRFASVKIALGFYGTVRAAPIYRTAPWGGVDQPAFLNSAIAVSTEKLTPIELLALLQEIERAHGRDRERETRWGPRPLDLDLLVWGARVIALPTLTVPHPRLAERRFALAPLVDLVGASFAIPGAGVAGELLARVGDQAAEAVASFR